MIPFEKTNRIFLNAVVLVGRGSRGSRGAVGPWRPWGRGTYL